ncbi:MAG: lipoprotein NlpD [Pseudohongiellaceae bacterium]|jgi:lipoprotein NlpD
MSLLIKKFKRWTVGLAFLAVVILQMSCGGKYQAPVRDQGEQQVSRAPIIAQSSSNESGGRVIERGSASTAGVSSSSMASANSSEPQPSRSVSSSASASTSSPGTTRRVPAVRRAADARTHTVRAGETLYSIAFQYDLDFRSLALANKLRAPYTIFVDQELNLAVTNISSGSRQSTINSSAGIAVSDNSVAQSQGGSSRTGGVLRQPIQASNSTPAWAWPHAGRIVRDFRDAGNKGLDIAGQLGDSVLAASAGDVVYSGRGVQGSGNLIIIRHNDRYLSAYAHNSAMLVGEGSRVVAGDKIAEVGLNSAGVAMLHFEIRLEGNSVDPSELLPSRR